MENTQILILGATGMLGHRLVMDLAGVDSFHVVGTMRGNDLSYTGLKRTSADIITGLDARDAGLRRSLITQVRPDIVINAVGVIKQRPGVSEAVNTVRVNGLLPHELAEECAVVGARLVHFSTDCVFSGERGLYRESDLPDPVDLYGRSKLAGEPAGGHVLVLRTSIVGHELQHHQSLVDWFLSQSGRVPGYTRAIYSGLTTNEMSHVIKDVVIPSPSLSGLYHLASKPISKFELLSSIADRYSHPVAVEPHDEYVCDRSMVADKLFRVTGYRAPSWESMVEEMYRAYEQEGARP